MASPETFARVETCQQLALKYNLTLRTEREGPQTLTLLNNEKNFLLVVEGPEAVNYMFFYLLGYNAKGGL